MKLWTTYISFFMLLVSLPTVDGQSNWIMVEKILESPNANTSILYGDRQIINGGDNTTINGYFNQFQRSDNGTSIGLNNFFAGQQGSKTGIRNYFSGGDNGAITGVTNTILNESSNYIKFGFKNFFNAFSGTAYGVINEIRTNASNTSDIHGTFNSMIHSGTGDAYGGYFSAVATLGTAYAAVFNNGHVIANNSGGDYDFRIESTTQSHAFWLDADRDLVIFGTNDPDLAGDGANIAGTTINFAADFDNGTNDGTAVGIGSREYLLDGLTETNINNGFAPLIHHTYDLGYSTMDRAWDDVYAKAFVTTSDRREKSNIKAMTYGLNEIMKLSPVSYTYTRDTRGETKLGLVAQDVLPLIKEVVKTHDYKFTKESPTIMEKVELERLGINYQELIPVLIKAIQEQQSQVNHLQELVIKQSKALQIQEKHTQDLEATLKQIQKDAHSNTKK